MIRIHHLTAALATCLALGALSSTASANNRAFDGLSAVPIDPSAATCFNNHDASPTMTNRCGVSEELFLPMSVDGTGMWYWGSVYGKGWIDGNGGQHSMACQINTAYHDGTFFSGNWQWLPGGGSFGGAQSIALGPAPIAAPGDTLFALCWMDTNTQIFSY